MKLSDLIIEHGPYGDRAGVSLWFGNACATGAAAELNELREELMAARAARELGERFLVYSAPISRRRGAQIGISHRGCPNHWWAEVDDFSGLAELNQRAGEHAEVCR